MKFKLSNFTLETPIYSVYFFKEISEKEFFQLCGILRYHCNRDNISWYAVYSTTESKTARRQAVKTGLRGRPKLEVRGKKVGGHTHVSLVGNRTQSANKTAIRIKKSLDKKYKKPICRIVSKGANFDACEWLGYCFKQASICRGGGDFDFEKYRIIL